MSLTLLYNPARPEQPVEGLSIFNNFRSWFDKLTTNDESRDFWDTTLVKGKNLVKTGSVVYVVSQRFYSLGMNVLLEKNDRTASITLERPPLNVLNLSMLRELQAALDSVRGDDALDFLLIRGSGERAFSAGVDVQDHTRDKVPEMLEVVHGVIRCFLSLPQITIALVRGACLGGGCELASSCDFILASDDSFFATPEIQVGCYPPVALARFPCQIGYHRAAEMILTGRRISAQEAAAIGLINRAVPARELEQTLEGLLGELKGKSRAVLRIALRGLREISLKNFSADLRNSEDLYLRELLKTDDVEEGVQAFLAKRKPRWSHH